MIMILVGWWARSESGCFCRQRPGLNFGIFVMVCSILRVPMFLVTQIKIQLDRGHTCTVAKQFKDEAACHQAFPNNICNAN